MQHRQRSGQSFFQPADELGSERDLRHQQQDVLSPCQHLLRQPQIDLGLAAAGHPVQQEGAVTPEACGDRCDSPVLFIFQCKIRLLWWVSRGCSRIQGDQSLVLQRPQDAMNAVELPAQIAHARLSPQRFQPIHDLPLPRRPALQNFQGLGVSIEKTDAVRTGKQGLFALAQPYRQRRKQNLAHGVMIIPRHPAEIVQMFPVHQGGVVQHGPDGPQPVSGNAGVIRHLDQDAAAFAAAKGHQQALTGLQRWRCGIFRGQIVEQAVHRRRQCNAQYHGHYSVVACG